MLLFSSLSFRLVRPSRGRKKTSLSHPHSHAQAGRLPPPHRLTDPSAALDLLVLLFFTKPEFAAAQPLLHAAAFTQQSALYERKKSVLVFARSGAFKSPRFRFRFVFVILFSYFSFAYVS